MTETAQAAAATATASVATSTGKGWTSLIDYGTQPFDSKASQLTGDMYTNLMMLNDVVKLKSMSVTPEKQAGLYTIVLTTLDNRTWVQTVQVAAAPGGEASYTFRVDTRWTQSEVTYRRPLSEAITKLLDHCRTLANVAVTFA